MMVKLQFQKVSNLKLNYLETCVLCCVTQLALRENGDDVCVIMHPYFIRIKIHII